MAKRPGANKDNYEETQGIFLALARLEFATHGYAKASTNRIVEQSGMARGSLYYHFKDKEDLFRAIYTRLTTDSNDEISAFLDKIDDPWEALIKGADIFFTHALDPVFRRIVLIEALVAIPYIERMGITGKNYAQSIGIVLERARQRGYLPEHIHMRPFGLLIYSILAEYGRALEYESNPEQAKKSLVQMFAWTLEKFKNPIPHDALFKPAA